MEFLKGLIRPVVPVKTNSTFYTDGKLTPDEFLAAGLFFFILLFFSYLFGFKMRLCRGITTSPMPHMEMV
jgi:tellurite resistance protein TehA-like permease